MDLINLKNKSLRILNVIFSFENLMILRLVFGLYNNVNSSKVIKVVTKVYCSVFCVVVLYKLMIACEIKAKPIQLGDFFNCIQLSLAAIIPLFEENKYFFEFCSGIYDISKSPVALILSYIYIVFSIIVIQLLSAFTSDRYFSFYNLTEIVTVVSLVIFNVLQIFVFDIFRTEFKSLKNQFIVDMTDLDGISKRENIVSFIKRYRDLLNKLKPLTLPRFYVSLIFLTFFY